MSVIVELAWADDGLDLAWRAGHALRLPLRLISASAGARAMIRIDEPSKHLAFELTAADGTTSSFTGRDFMALAGDPTHEGVAITDTLPAGASWVFTHALDAWAEPPARGRYVLRARYVTPDGAVAETPPRAVDVVPADHVASGHARLASSGLYLAHALATPTAVSLRVAGYAAPRGPPSHSTRARGPARGASRSRSTPSRRGPTRRCPRFATGPCGRATDASAARASITRATSRRASKCRSRSMRAPACSSPCSSKTARCACPSTRRPAAHRASCGSTSTPRGSAPSRARRTSRRARSSCA